MATSHENQTKDQDLTVEEEDHMADEEHLPWCTARLVAIRKNLATWIASHETLVMFSFKSVLIILYSCYFGYAMYYSFSRNVALFALTVFAVVLIIFQYAKGSILRSLSRITNRYSTTLRKIKRYGKWVFAVLAVGGLIAFIVLEVRFQPARLLSGAGVFVFLIIAWLFSKDKSKVKLDIVVSGLCIQLVFGLLILRWDRGLQAFEWLGDQVNIFLTYTDAGSKFVFGPGEMIHPTAFVSLTTVAFYGAVVVLLYYLGILQSITKALGVVMETLMGIGPVEAFVAAANIFLGPVTSVIAIAPLIPEMTMSELHTVLTTSFATVTGGFLGIFNALGVPPTHLVAASFMSAPAALVVSKVLYPEVQKSTLADIGNIKFPKPPENSALEAFTNGASSTVGILSGVVASLIAFVSLITAINAFFGWAGARVGIFNLTLEVMFSYVFAPIAFIIGVPTEDCLLVGELLGTKIFSGTVIGYSALGRLITNRQEGLEPSLLPRSEVLTSYALCGLGTFTDLGITLGVLASMVPSRIGDLADLGLRSMTGGNLACFITACLAGFLSSFD